MVLVSASVDAFVFTAVAVAVPLYLYLRQRNSGSRPQSPYEPFLTILVALHTLYTLHALLLRRPPNLFTHLHIPLTASPATIRTTLLRRAGLPADARLPRPLEDLLTRLASLEMRTLYVRFGHAVLHDCAHCRTLDDYALFALPRALADYLRAAALAGLLTARRTARARWRTHVVAALLAAAVLEAYCVATATVDVPPNGLDVFMWHDRLWAARQLAFLLAPLLTHLVLPAAPAPPADPAAPVLTATAALEHASTRLAALRYTRGAVMREPRLRAAATAWWARAREEGAWARADDGVRRVAERLGKGFAEGGDAEGGAPGRLRTFAREAVARFRAGLVGAEEPPLQAG